MGVTGALKGLEVASALQSLEQKPQTGLNAIPGLPPGLEMLRTKIGFPSPAPLPGPQRPAPPEINDLTSILKLIQGFQGGGGSRPAQPQLGAGVQ